MNAVSNSVVMYKNGGYDPSTRLLAAAAAGGSLTKHNGVKVLGHANLTHFGPIWCKEFTHLKKKSDSNSFFLTHRPFWPQFQIQLSLI